MESLVYCLKEQLIAWRRDFHQHPESAWQEIRTAAVIAEVLQDLGYTVKAGKDVISAEHRVALPAAADLDRAATRAEAQGVKERWIRVFRDGFTGVTAELDTGRPGPTLAMRFDIDANDLEEAADNTHRPYRQGFSSVNEGACHACGHDAHAAIGLGVAAVLKEMADRLTGKVRLIFQPAEEGSRGARAMIETGVVEGVDYFLSGHLGFGAQKSGQVICGTKGFLATTKTDVVFTGVPSHAGGFPEEGRNALLAAASTSMALYALPRHSKGASRVNVGVLHAGEARNIIPAKARMSFETRGLTTEINDFMVRQAEQIIKGQAMSFGVEYKIIPMGGAPGADSDRPLVERVMRLAAKAPGVTELIEICDFGASEDVTYMMDRVQQQGGQATYLMFGADMTAPHHNGKFDFDEEALVTAVHVLSLVAEDILK